MRALEPLSEDYKRKRFLKKSNNLISDAFNTRI